MATGNSKTAAINAIMGASGCGKTSHLIALLRKRKRKRTLIWSPKEKEDDYASFYPGSEVVNTVGDVLRILRAAGKGECHIVYKPRLIRKTDEEQFSAVCKIAVACENITFIVDELHTVTRPTWSPDGWRKMVLMGRAYGMEVFGLSQRPASVDKDFYSNLSSIHCGRMAFEPDCKAVAPALGVTWTEVSALSGYQWIERDILTGAIKRGG